LFIALIVVAIVAYLTVIIWRRAKMWDKGYHRKNSAHRQT
jgi:cytochrome c-type biogenesis protein CcmH/NrfG